MTYYDPLAPSLEATRLGIQRSISTLQQKMRQMRELDLDAEYLRNQELERRCELAHYHRDISNNISYHALPPPTLYAHDRYFAQRSRYAMEEEEKNITHLQRMRELELEQLQLNKQKLRETVPFFGAPRPYQLYPEYPHSYNRSNEYISYDDEDALLRKYQDGTFAQKMREELNSISHPNSAIKGSHQFQRKPISRPLAAEFQPEHDPARAKYSSAQKFAPKPNQFSTSQERSPYSKLNYETDNKGQTGLNIFKNEGIRSPSKQAKDDNINQEETDRQVFQSSNRKNKTRSKSFKQFEVSRENWTDNSMLNKAYKPQSGRKSSQKSPLKMSVLERSRAGNLSIEDAAKLKIKNRLKVSEIIFEDSKFRNKKHETSHLQMTLENQLKIRKEIKDKINSHPVVLRKHAMVVEG